MENFDNEFPGNNATLAKLLKDMPKGAIAFTGAGTSMPDLPSWQMLLKKLLDTAKQEGRITEDNYTILEADKDTLYVADQLADIFGSQQLKSKIVDNFSSLKSPSSAHLCISNTNFKKYMTLNYDIGIELAIAQQRATHISTTTPKQNNELNKWMEARPESGASSVLHWHGSTTHAEEIILTGSDYIDFYEAKPQNKEILREIFRRNTIIMVGFGFSDPFITTQLESVMRVMATDNQHFGIIGVPANSGNMILERKKFALKYKMDLMFYPVVSDSEGNQDHSGLLSILNNIQQSFPASAAPENPGTLKKNEDDSYTSSLYSVGENKIYCEPNIIPMRSLSETSQNQVNISEIVISKSNLCIFAPHEFGLTTLGKRICSEINANGSVGVFRDSGSLPNYKKKLITDSDIGLFQKGGDFTLVLDNFSPIEHERLANELIATFPGLRLIILQRVSPSIGVDVDFIRENTFEVLELKGLRRNDIRHVANVFLNYQTEDQISAVVEKIYNDLLQLCIPLTPSNVIMYCGVLYKDGDFSPVSRLQIVERFISGALQRASDSYADSFNLNNKIDLISSFCSEIFNLSRPSFTEQEWTDFCEKYRRETLMRFNGREILSDLVSGRIIKREGGEMVFRYRMFFSYFVGRYISSRPELMDRCIQENKHLSLDGMIEVLCGLATDSTKIIEDLNTKLKHALSDFYDNYPISGLCFHEGAEWAITGEEKLIWDGITKRLNEGPSSGVEIDNLKTSILSERRTSDQKVSIIKFIASERPVSMMSAQLRVALDNAANCKGSAKVSGALAVMQGARLTYEVATVLAPMIAQQKYVSWNGFTYVNLIENEFSSADNSEFNSRMLEEVLSALPQSICRGTADKFGSRKLGPVFLEIAKTTGEKDFAKALIFCLLLRSKPDGWVYTAKNMISSTKRDDIFLYHMLGLAYVQYKYEVNTSKDRLHLKEIIASVQVLRGLNIKNPNSSTMNEAIEALEKHEIFSEKKN